MRIIRNNNILDWIQAYAVIIADNKEYLTKLDSDIGDGDHGINMNRGFKAVAAKLPSLADKDIGTIFKTIAITLISTVGGASGPLYGTFFLQMSTTTQGETELNLDDWISTFQAGVEGVIMRGKANVGDKTMIDSLHPALQALKESQKNGLDISDAIKLSAHAAEQGMLSTIPLLARKGRASYLGERSIGHQDPGATSSFLLIKVAADCWK